MSLHGSGVDPQAVPDLEDGIRRPPPQLRRATVARRVFVYLAVALSLSAGGLRAQPSSSVAGSGEPDCQAVLPPDLLRICERGELRVARYSGERPPFFFRRGTAWVGFDVDLGRDIAARMGVRYFEDSSAESFDVVVERVASGDADLAISKLSGTLERALRVRFSKPYLTVYQALMVNRLSSPGSGDAFGVLNAESFAIGALAGTAYVGYARSSFAEAEVRPYDDFDAMMEAVVAGELDAALMDSARANTWRTAHSQQLIQVRTVMDRSRRDPLAVGVAWENTHLLAWIDLYLDEIRADGTAERLYRKWFVDRGAGAEVSPSDRLGEP